MSEKKIICDLPNRNANSEGNCAGVLAHLISPRMIQAVRQNDQRFTLTVNQNAQLALTCPRCVRVHSFIWRMGVLDQSAFKLEDVKPKTPTPEETPEPTPEATPAPTPAPEETLAPEEK